jgi:hypothetical protein
VIQELSTFRPDSNNPHLTEGLSTSRLVKSNILHIIQELSTCKLDNNNLIMIQELFTSEMNSIT